MISTMAVIPITFTHISTSYLLPIERPGLYKRKRFALVTTVTDDNDIAAPAMIGLRSQPVNGNSNPAATGIPREL